MLAVYLGFYIFLLAILWGFFLIARHHAFKFKAFSKNIVFTTNILCIFLIILSIFGAILIFNLDLDSSFVSIDTSESFDSISY